MISMLKRGDAVLLSAVFSVTALHGQETSPAPKQVFRAGTELVRVDVRVTDDSGRPIPDLRSEEVEVVENGQTRPVLVFQRIEQPDAPYLELARRTIAGEISTNQGSPRGHLYVLIFDQGHITPGNEQRARLATAQFLRTRVQPGDRVALYAVPGPGPQIGFTSNVQQALEALPKVRGSLEKIFQGGLGAMRINEAYEIQRGNAGMLDTVATRLSSQAAGTDVLSVTGASAPGSGGDAGAQFRFLVQEDARAMVARADQQARNFLQMFSDVMRELGTIEGRKSVILLSEGFFPDGVTRELEQVAAAAAESYAVIHALDLNKRQVDLRAEEPLGGEQYTEIQSRIASLGSLAAETNGTLFVDASEALDRSLAAVAADSQDYYIVGFEPASHRDRGQYRRIKINVRRPGARVHARTGYSTAAPRRTPADRRRAIDAALRAPFPQQGLPVRYTTYVLRSPSRGMQRIFVSLAADLPLHDDGSKPADVVFVVRDARTSRVAASGTDVLPLPQSARTGSSVGAGSYKVQFDLPAGEYLMRVVVREPAGLIGSADRRFSVRALDRADVTFSDLVLGDNTGPLPVQAVASADSGLAGTMELYAPDPSLLDDMLVTMQLGRIGQEQPRQTIEADLLAVKTSDSGVSRPARLMVPLNGVPPGDYIVTAVVTARGEQVGTAARELRVVEGALPATAMTVAAVNPAGMLKGEPARRYAQALQRRAADTPLQAAADLAARGEWQRAAAALPRGAESDPTASALRGLAAFAAGDYPRAAGELRRAFDADPENALAGFVLGWAYEGAGRTRDAIGAWRGAAHLDPALVPAHLAVVDACLRLHEPALALQAIRIGLAALPDSPELNNRLAMLEKRF